jgi:dTMP kinase
MKNLFIVFDSMDCCGKSTHLARLHEYLYKKDKRIRILTTREPTYGKYGIKAREMLTSQEDPYSHPDELLNLYINDREEHIKKTIKPFLKPDHHNRAIVLCDRYYYSTIAYQHTQGLDFDKVINLNKKFLKPDLGIILEVNPSEAIRRISSERDNEEKFEKIDFMKKLFQNFRKLKKELEDNLVYIDTSGTQEETFKKIKRAVDKIL